MNRRVKKSKAGFVSKRYTHTQKSPRVKGVKTFVWLVLLCTYCIVAGGILSA